MILHSCILLTSTSNRILIFSKKKSKGKNWVFKITYFLTVRRISVSNISNKLILKEIPDVRQKEKSCSKIKHLLWNLFWF